MHRQRQPHRPSGHGVCRGTGDGGLLSRNLRLRRGGHVRALLLLLLLLSLVAAEEFARYKSDVRPRRPEEVVRISKQRRGDSER